MQHDELPPIPTDQLLQKIADFGQDQEREPARGLSDDGENLPVRWFLAVYGGNRGLTVGSMKTHLRHCGFPFWPDWCDKAGADGEHLNKAAAQAWLRYLFALEQAATLTAGRDET